LGTSFLVTVGGASSGFPVTLGVNIAAKPTANSAYLFLANAGSIAAQDPVSMTNATVTSLGDSTGFPMKSETMIFLAPDVASTYGNYPNPFHPETGNTTIEFNLATPSIYSLVIYDILGKRVKTFQSNGLQSGLQQLSWNGKNDAGVSVLSGIYYAQLNTGGNQYFLKIAVVY
jgi:hypothetical protein